MSNARLDDRGRIKLPIEFQRFFGALDDKRLFVTYVDRRIARIFPMAVWRAYEQSLESYHENPKAAQRMLFNAADLGGEAEMDNQGRILFSPELRRGLEMENQSLRLRSSKGWVEVLSEKTYEEMKNDAAQVTAEDILNVEKPRLN